MSPRCSRAAVVVLFVSAFLLGFRLGETSEPPDYDCR